MRKPRFNLKNKSESNTLISLIYRPFGERLVYSTKLFIPPKYWNPNIMRARTTQEFMDHFHINNELDKIERIASTLAKEYRSKDQELSPMSFKSEMDKRYLGKESHSDQAVDDFSSFINKFIKERSDSPTYTPGSIKVYKTSTKHLNEFARGKRIRFNDLTLEFFLGFIQYLYSKNYSNNHIHKIVSTVKTILNDATERGFNTNMAFKHRKISVPKTESDNVYLNEHDLLKLYDVDLSSNDRLDKVRDLFLIAAYTGLRFSDFTVLKPHNIREIEGQQVFDTSVGKTRDRVIIPIHPIVRSILDKYHNILPKPISNQKMNDYLKDLCELSGLTEKIIKREYRGGKMYEMSYPMYKLVSSHTGRRSFATNAYKAGLPMLNIMRITGHKKPETFLKYIKFDNEENAVMMAKHPFFQSQ